MNIDAELDNLIIQKNFSNEEIEQNIKDITLDPPRQAYQIFFDEFALSKKGSNSNSTQLKSLAQCKWKEMGKKEKAFFNEKEKEENEKFYKDFNLVEKYLILDYNKPFKKASDFYVDRYVKKAKSQGEDPVDARVFAELNYASMKGTQKKHWENLCVANNRKWEEMNDNIYKIDPFLEFFLKTIRTKYYKRGVDRDTLKKELPVFRNERFDELKKIHQEFCKYRNQMKERIFIYELENKIVPSIVYHKQSYIMEKNALSLIGISAIERNKAIKQFGTEESLTPEEKKECEQKIRREQLKKKYRVYMKNNENDLYFHEVITPKMLFYCENMNNKEMNELKTPIEKIEFLKQLWKGASEKTQKEYENKHMKIRIQKEKEKQKLKQVEKKPKNSKNKKKKEGKKSSIKVKDDNPNLSDEQKESSDDDFVDEDEEEEQNNKEDKKDIEENTNEETITKENENIVIDKNEGKKEKIIKNKPYKRRNRVTRRTIHIKSENGIKKNDEREVESKKENISNNNQEKASPKNSSVPNGVLKYIDHTNSIDKKKPTPLIDNK